MATDGTGFSEATFRWLSDLAQNNDSTWFAANRDTFVEHVDEPFTYLLEEVSRRLAGTAAPLQGGAATTFRIQRDVRFSADKSPYSTYRSGVLTPSGTKSESEGLVYVQLSADGGFMAGGLYKPRTDRLDPLRQSMVEHPDAFAEVLGRLAAAGYELDRADAVKTMPRGYAEHAEHPHAPYLRLKQLVVLQPLPRKTWLDGSVVDRVSGFAVAVAPLLDLVRRTDRASAA